MSRLRIQHKLTTAFHPQSNGAVERFHRRLKDALWARLAGQDWLSHLLWVLLGLRAAPREDSGLSSSELVFGAPLSLPGQFLSAARGHLAAAELGDTLCGPVTATAAGGIIATYFFNGGGFRLRAVSPSIAGV
jgi:hypothetical protein